MVSAFLFKSMLASIAIVLISSCDRVVKAVDPIALEISNQVGDEPRGTKADLSVIFPPGEKLSVLQEVLPRFDYDVVAGLPPTPTEDAHRIGNRGPHMVFRRYRGMSDCRMGYYVIIEFNEQDEVLRATGEMHESGCS